jgi:hypothetical protein
VNDIHADVTKKIAMSEIEYLAYWARDERGEYVGTEPQEAGRMIWRRKLWAELYLSPPETLDVSAWAGRNATTSQRGIWGMSI